MADLVYSVDCNLSEEHFQKSINSLGWTLSVFAKTMMVQRVGLIFAVSILAICDKLIPEA